MDQTNSNQGEETRPFSSYESLGPIPTIGPPRIYQVNVSSAKGESASLLLMNPTSTISNVITPEMRAELERDGAICVRGLISDNLLQRLDAESAILVDEQRQKDAGRQRRGTQFHTVSHSAIFRRDFIVQADGDDDSKTESDWDASALMEVALWSPVPAFAASLLLNASGTCSNSFRDNEDEDSDDTKLNNPSEQCSTRERLRVIRDIFLAKDDDHYVCGWHVDDMGFWPATPESPGINAWIALDDMEVTEETGGFALAVQSHTAPWREEAYYWTGASTNYPDGGYANASDFFARRTGTGTCNLKQSAKHIHQRMEETSRIYPVKRGDVIFHTRWLFHRTVAVDKRNRAAKMSNADEHSSRVYRRYSIRYGPGSSVVPRGYGTELSVLWNETNGGMSADHICERDGPWYPQAWPHMEGTTKASFWNNLSSLLAEKIPVAEERRERRKQEMKPFLKRMAKQQNKFSTYGQ